MPTTIRGLNDGFRFGGIGHREHDLADYAGARLKTIVHEIEQGTMDTTRFTGVAVGLTLGITDAAIAVTPLPKTFTLGAGLAVKHNCNLMALTYQILTDATVTSRSLTIAVYGISQFGTPICERVTWSAIPASTLSPKYGSKIFARIDKWVVESALHIQDLDVVSFGVALGDGGVNGTTILPANPKFALPCRVKDLDDVIACRAYVYGMNAYVNYTAGLGAANVPTAWRLGEAVYQGASLAAATAKGILIAAYDSDSAGVDTKYGRILIQQVTGLFANGVPLRQDETNQGVVAAATIKATATTANSGAAGYIIGHSSWDKALNFRDYLSGVKMTLDQGNSAVTLSNLGVVSDATSIDAQGWQQLHWRYRIEITCRTSIGVRSKRR